jgi:hypothetical protein
LLPLTHTILSSTALKPRKLVFVSFVSTWILAVFFWAMEAVKAEQTAIRRRSRFMIMNYAGMNLRVTRRLATSK